MSDNIRNIIRKALNESNLPNSFFYDYDFKYAGESLESLVMSYKHKPTDRMVLADLMLVKNRFREGSQYADFAPTVGIVYAFVYGHNMGWNAYLTINSNTKYLERPFFDEPTGKYGKSRRLVKFK